MRVGTRMRCARLIGAGGIERRRGLEREAARRGRPRRGDRERGVGALREADRGDPRRIDVGAAGEKRKRAIGVGRAVREIDGAGLLEAAGSEIVDEERNIAPLRDLGSDRLSVRRQAEAGVQQHDGGERPASGRCRQIAANADARGAREGHEFVGLGRRGEAKSARSADMAKSTAL